MDNNRIAISALGKVAPREILYLQVGETTVELKKRLTSKEILDMVQFIVDYTITDQPIISGVVSQMIFDFAMVSAYTNLELAITIKGKELEEIYNEYDILSEFDIFEEIRQKVDRKQLSLIERTAKITIDSVITYRNSARGIIDSLSGAAEDDADKMQKAISMLNGESGEQLANLIQFSHEIRKPADN